MKSNSMLYIGLVCFALGAILFGFAFWQEGFNLSAFSTSGKYENKTYTTLEKVEKINITDKNVRFEVEKSTDGQLHIEYMENKRNKYNINLSSDGKLEMQNDQSADKWYYHIINLDFAPQYIVLKVPENYSGDINLNTSNSTIDIEGITANNVYAKTSNGKVKVNNVKIAGTFEARSTNSSINVEYSEIGNQMTCDTSNGKVIVADLKAMSTSLETSNSRVEIENSTFNGELEVETSNGSIEIEEIQVEKDINFKTSNASVEGTIKGQMSDYTFECRTSNANSNLPDGLGEGEKLLKIKTSNGKIDVKFIK